MKSKLVEQHNEWLKKMGVTMRPKRVKTSPYSLPNLRKDLRNSIPTSDSVGNGYSKGKKSYSGEKSLCVGQAYNKGNYVVLSNEDAKDASTGKRR